jgi:hypothetical protein
MLGECNITSLHNFVVIRYIHTYMYFGARLVFVPSLLATTSTTVHVCNGSSRFVTLYL